MKLDKTLLQFLRGEIFSSGCNFTLKGSFEERSRLTYMQRVVKGAKVLHIGCVDHTPDKVKRKLARGVWLHKLLMDSASLCAGVDINKEGIEFLSKEMKLPHVYCGNILTDEIPGVNDVQWEYVILGELLEHVDNPVQFLETLRQRPGLEKAKCIITVPNAFHYKNFKKALKQYEDINSDHRYWFTPYTLSKVLVMAGYDVDDIQLTQDRAFTFFPPIPWFLLKRYPLLRSKVVALASPPQ
nr:methyltransferase domain-containing protein [uncultured Pseudodesulfovibrio sp.]